MSNAPRTIFVEPCDGYTNQVIATQLLTEEEHFYRDKLANDGSEHSVWEFDHTNLRKLMTLLYNTEARFYLFRENGAGRLVSVSRVKILYPNVR